MKKKILIILSVLAALAVLFVAIAVKGRVRADYTEELVRAINGISGAELSALSREVNEPGNGWWASVPGGEIQKGILKLQNGEIIRFAFISHHATKDRNSHSYFKGQNYRKYVRGWFCCEVEFYEKNQPKDITELDLLLSKYDGVPP